MQVSRSGTFVAGIVTALALGGGTAVAAGDAAVLLGKGNPTKTTTGIANSKGTPLSLVAKKGTPPLKVNNTMKVKNLNSDLLDGDSASAFLPSAGTAANSALLNGQPASAYLGADGTAVNATQLGGQPATAYLSSSGTAADSADLGGQPAASYLSTVYTNQVDSTAPGATKILLSSGSAFDAVSVPAGSYTVTFTADLANTDATPGEFGCHLVFETATATENGFFGNVSLNPTNGINTSGSTTITQAVIAPEAATISAHCFVNQGDTAHTSFVYDSTLTATRVQDLLGTAHTIGVSP